MPMRVMWKDPRNVHRAALTALARRFTPTLRSSMRASAARDSAASLRTEKREQTGATVP